MACLHEIWKNLPHGCVTWIAQIRGCATVATERMHIVITPNLDGLADERLRAFAAPEEIQAAKDNIRRELQPALATQFADPQVCAFTRNLEPPPFASQCRIPPRS